MNLKRVFNVFLLIFFIYGSVLYADEYTISTNDGLELSFTSSGELSGIKIDNESLSIIKGPVLWIRDMTNAGSVISPNLITNYGFETGMTNWDIIKSSDSDITVSDNKSRTGKYSLQIHAEKENGFAVAAVSSEAIPVTSGKIYRVSAYFLSSRGYVQGPDGTPPVRQDSMWRGELATTGLYVKWYDKNGKALEDDYTLIAPLHWNADNWRKVNGEIFSPENASYMKIIIGSKLEEQYLWVDDLTVIESPEQETAITGTISSVNGDIVQKADISDGMSITITYSSHSKYLGVNIKIKNSSANNKSFELVWGLPIKIGSGWYWWDDVRNKREISSSNVAVKKDDYNFPECLSHIYENIVSGVWDGWLPVSLYPYAAMEDGETGLALAYSLDKPALVKLAYDQTKSRYEAKAYIGISSVATKLNNSAEINFELYKFDPEWGYRAVIKKFAENHPEWFTTDRQDFCSVGFNRDYFYTAESAKEVLNDDSKNILSLQYTVADAPVDIGSVKSPIPSYDDTISSLDNSDDKKKDAVENSVAYNSNGDWQIKHIGEFEWNMGTWQTVWFTSIDPDISDGWGQYLYENTIYPSIKYTEDTGAVLDGIMMDNYLTAPGIDLRDSHIAVADLPLSYDVTTYLPGVHNSSNMYEFFSWLRKKFTELNRDDLMITANFWGIGSPANGTVSLIDAFGNEGNIGSDDTVSWNTRILDYRRAIAYHKKISFSNGGDNLKIEQIKNFLNLALFYAIFPVKKGDALNWESGYETDWNNSTELLLKFNSKGWEPITYAVTNDSDVYVERYGSHFYQCDDVVFTVYNDSENDKNINLTIYLDKLGFSTSDINVKNMRDDLKVSSKISGNSLIVPLKIKSKDTLVLKIFQDNISQIGYSPSVKIFPETGIFSIKTPIDFGFTISDANGLENITDFKFIFCEQDITKDIEELLAHYITDLTDSLITVTIPDITFPSGNWSIKIITEDISGNKGCDNVNYFIPLSE